MYCALQYYSTIQTTCSVEPAPDLREIEKSEIRGRSGAYTYYVLHRYTIEHIVREKEGAPR